MGMYFTLIQIYTFDRIRSFLLGMKSVAANKSCRENQNTHSIFSIFLENRAIYDIMLNNIF
jgi:hypothetical protein